MQVSEFQIKKILSGEKQCKFTQISLNMLFMRLSMNYKKSPTNDVLRTSVNEINAMLAKFPTVMKQDYELITRL